MWDALPQGLVLCALNVELHELHRATGQRVNEVAEADGADLHVLAALVQVGTPLLVLAVLDVCLCAMVLHVCVERHCALFRPRGVRVEMRMETPLSVVCRQRLQAWLLVRVRFHAQSADLLGAVRWLAKGLGELVQQRFGGRVLGGLKEFADLHTDVGAHVQVYLRTIAHPSGMIVVGLRHIRHAVGVHLRAAANRHFPGQEPDSMHW
mmetsp:Transcript_182440/g.444062  ORF Transcript_182440/g.444062 Transcript_182440/m.444062 type:complete len:208 (-) Transcript_182440:137-760(-)